MKRFSLLLIMLTMVFTESFTQHVISGKSKPKAFAPVRDSLPKLPPNLTAKLEFSEPSGDKIVEGGETALIKLTLFNIGKGEAHLLKIKITDEVVDPSFSFESAKEINSLLPEHNVDLNFPIATDYNLKSNKHILHFEVNEGNGYDLDPPIQLILYTVEYRKPQLSFMGYEVCDTCEGTSPINPDNIIQPGEMAKVSMFIKNIGLNTARDVNYKVISRDQNVNLTQSSGKLGDLATGENKSFMMYVSPNKKFKNAELPLFLSLSLYNNIGNLDNLPVPVFVSQKPSEKVVIEVVPTAKTVEQPNLQTEKLIPETDNLKNIELAPLSKTRRYNAVAIVIGIENYSNLPRAAYAENDAKIITNYFKNTLGISNVLTFNSEKVTNTFFDNMFNLESGILKSMVVQGTTDVYIFFSGHGLPSAVGEQIYLMPSDGNKDRVSNQAQNVTTWYDNLKDIGARNVIVFLDACFSGISRQSETIKPENLMGVNTVKSGTKLKDPWIVHPAFSIFNSSASDGATFASDQSKTGLFTYFLSLGLQGEADINNDKRITTGELEQYLQKEVLQASKRIGGIQTTQFHGNRNYVLTEF